MTLNTITSLQQSGDVVSTYKSVFKKGERVKPDPNHSDYGGWKNQYNGIGIITGRYDRNWAEVMWENGQRYMYPDDMLIPIDHDYDPKINIMR